MVRLLFLVGLLARPARSYVAAPRLPNVQRSEPADFGWRRAHVTGVALAAANVEAPYAAASTDSHHSSRPQAEVVVESAPKGRVRYALWAAKRSIWIWANVLGHTWKVASLRKSGLQGRKLVDARRQRGTDLPHVHIFEPYNNHRHDQLHLNGFAANKEGKDTTKVCVEHGY